MEIVARVSPRIIVALAVSALLGSCATTPQKTLRERQAEALARLGFHQEDDQDWLLSLPERISFPFDSDRLKPEFMPKIANVAHQLQDVDIHRLQVEGHSDNKGPDDYNLSLSERRAEAVARVLEDNGYAAGDVSRDGVGSAHPAASNDTAEGRAENRRVEIIVQAGSLAGP